MMSEMVRGMGGEDFDWAAELLERRRQEYVAYSPVFWRPAEDVVAAHARFLRATAEREGAVAVRSDHAFAISAGHDGRCVVDDFAVERADLWSTEGQDVLLAVWSAARSDAQRRLRVVTARRDAPKRQMLVGLGLHVAERWWVKDVATTAEETTWGPVALDGVDALIVPAPPVYDPGGPVCLLGDVESGHAEAAAVAAGRHGAVLAVVQRGSGSSAAPASDPVLEAAGFHNPSEFYEGVPS
jgi:hypothetical protein